jgi:hypothetical protein
VASHRGAQTSSTEHGGGYSGSLEKGGIGGVALVMAAMVAVKTIIVKTVGMAAGTAVVEMLTEKMVVAGKGLRREAECSTLQLVTATRALCQGTGLL